MTHLFSSARAKRTVVGICVVGTTVIALAASGALAAGTPTPSNETSGSELPPGPLTQSKADSVARLFAREIAGDADPTAQESVSATRGNAVGLLMPSSGMAHGSPAGLETTVESEPVYVETMRGNFTLQTSVRKGAPLPTGTSLTVFLSAKTGYVVGVELSNEAPARQTLTHLGAVRSVE